MTGREEAAALRDAVAMALHWARGDMWAVGVLARYIEAGAPGATAVFRDACDAVEHATGVTFGDRSARAQAVFAGYLAEAALSAEGLGA